MSRPSKIIKTGAKKAINVSLTQGKKVAKKSPRLTKFLRNTMLDYVNIEAAAVANNRYQQWVMQNYPDAIELLREKQHVQSFKYKPIISILVPTYNTDKNFLKDCIESVQSQTYENWELILVDDASPDSSVREQIQEFASKDKRVKYKFREKNGHISAASNDALDMSKGEFIALLDHDDIMWPNALYENIKALNSDKKIDFLYSDEDKITANRWEHKDLFLKPDWNPEFLESVNYITHFSVLRRKVVKEVGGFRSEYDGAQDWDLFLRVSAATKHIHHIPKVLYSWRISATSAASGIEAKPYALERQRLAIQESLKQRGYGSAKVIKGMSSDVWTVEHPVKGSPLVSIVIPTKDHPELIKKCIQSIFKKTTYKRFEIILVDTGTTNHKVLKWYERIQSSHKNVKVFIWAEQPFSYSKSCNYGVDKANGEYVMLLNNDIEVISSNWLEVMLGDAQRVDVGGVGCKLYYPDKLHIQHAGIGIGLNRTAANLLSKLPKNNLTLIQLLYSKTRHELSAVTAACLMIKKERFKEIGGFDDKFRVTYNDVDLCLKLKEAGYRNIYNPCVELIHHESISVGLPETLKKKQDKGKLKRDNAELDQTTKLLQNRWKKYIDHDPHLNPNMDYSTAYLEPYLKKQDELNNPTQSN